MPISKMSSRRPFFEHYHYKKKSGHEFLTDRDYIVLKLDSDELEKNSSAAFSACLLHSFMRMPDRPSATADKTPNTLRNAGVSA